MANPAWITSENVRFNGTTQNAAVLKTSGGIRTLVLWDSLTGSEQTELTDFVNTYGGTLPLAGARAGYQIANFAGTVVGGNATGLSNIATATSAVATINLGGTAIAGNASGLATSSVSKGSRTVTFSTPIATTTNTGLVPTAGYQSVTFSSAITGGGTTGLAGGTTYTSTITVDGVAKPISILGSTAQTFTTLVNEINTDLGASATASIANGGIKVTSATTGTSSSVLIVTGTLFSALTNFSAITTAVAGTGTVAALTATVIVDGVTKAISVLPSAIPTFNDVINEINTDLGAAAIASISGGNIKITSATAGSTSLVSITPGTLFPALPYYTSVLPTQNGGAPTKTYSAIVVVDGVSKTISFLGTAGTTFTNVLSEINADLGAAATASISGGNIIITSATTGTSSSVVVYDTGFLFNRLTGYVGITNGVGTSPTTYTATITVDGVAKSISVAGNAAQTFTTLVSEINTDLGASATASISNGNIKITSATTGASSSVVIADNNLFSAVGVKWLDTPVPGITDLVTAAKAYNILNGSSLYYRLRFQTVGTKPVVPVPCPHTIDFVYWNGTNWKYLDNDANV